MILDSWTTHSCSIKEGPMILPDEIKARDLDVSFVASSRVDRVDPESYLQNLKSSGLKTIYYGVESGSQRILDLMKKGITLKTC